MSFINAYTMLLLQFLVNPTENSNKLNKFLKKCEEDNIKRLIYPIGYYKKQLRKVGIEMLNINIEYLHPDVVDGHLNLVRGGQKPKVFRRIHYPNTQKIKYMDIGFCIEPLYTRIRGYDVNGDVI